MAILTVATNESDTDLTAIYLNGIKIVEARDYELTPFSTIETLQSYGLIAEDVEVEEAVVEFDSDIAEYPDEIETEDD